MALDKGSRTEKILEDDFLLPKFLGEPFRNNSQIWGDKYKKYNL